MSCDKMETYLNFQKTYKQYTWHNGDLVWGASTDKVECPFDLLFTGCYLPE